MTERVADIASDDGRRIDTRPVGDRVRVTVYLDSDLTEWGKSQPGGLSDLLRQLLKEARQDRSGSPDRYPPELRSRYRALIEKKLSHGLIAAEESELSAVRESIDRIDRSGASHQTQSDAIERIDTEIASLRSLLESRPEIESRPERVTSPASRRR